MNQLNSLAPPQKSIPLEGEAAMNQLSSAAPPKKFSPLEEAEVNHLSTLQSVDEDVMSSTRDCPPSMGSSKDKLLKCALHLSDKSTLVAKGHAVVSVNGSVPMLHCKPLSADMLKVFVDIVVDEKACLPVPTDEMLTVKDAVGSIVAWPKKFVVFGMNQIAKQKLDSDRQWKEMEKRDRKAARERAMDKCLKLINSKVDFMFTMKMPKEVVQHTHSVNVMKEDLKAWVEREEVEFNHIDIYIRFLIEKCKKSLYKFLCPQRVAYNAKTSKDINSDDRPRYISFAMSESKGDFWLLPYHEGRHWILAIIDPALAIIYCLDPLGYGVSKYFKALCNCALSLYQAKSLNSKPPEIQFKIVKCPKQEDFISCGLYVCRFMRDIMHTQPRNLPLEFLFSSPTSYTEEQMNEVIEEGVQFIEPYLDLELKIL